MKIKNKLTVTQKHNLKGLLFMLPFYLGLIFFFIEPIIESLMNVFCDVKVGSFDYDRTFTGLQNLKYIWNEDEYFKTQLFTDFLNILWKTPTIVILSLFLALLINKPFKGRLFVRAVFFLPVIFSNGVLLDVVQSDSAVQTAIEATAMMDSAATATTGGLSELLNQAGFSQEIINFATMLTDSFFSLIWNSGIQMLIFLSGLQSVSPALYEAASVEGASGWDIFCKITIPMLSPMIILNVIYTIVDSYASTSGGVIGMVTNALNLGRYGRASTMAWLYFLFIALILGVIFIISAIMSKPKKVRE